MVSLLVLRLKQTFMKNSIKNLFNELKIPDFKGEICVALSGGADSVCLLHLLYELSKSNDFILSAVHINHHLRGEESNQDALFCKELCKNLNVDLKIYDVDILNSAHQGESVELTARRLRYEIFDLLNADYIATAHNADDSLETFLINFSRGSGIKGLCGIPFKRDKFIRPILNFSKTEILEYCKENNLKYVTDSTNLTDDYLRNKVRHHIVPELEKINPAIKKVAVRNFSLLKTDSEFLEQMANDGFIDCFDVEKGLNLEKLLTYHKAISSRIIMIYGDKITNRTVDNLHLDLMLKLCADKKGKIELFDGYFATVKKGWLSIYKNQTTTFTVQTEVVDIKNYKMSNNVNNLFLKNAMDYDKIVGELVIRKRMPNDRMSPVGRGLSKPLRRLQAEANIPNQERDKVPVVADNNGVIWSYGVGICERVKIDKNTKKVLEFKVYK